MKKNLIKCSQNIGNQLVQDHNSIPKNCLYILERLNGKEIYNKLLDVTDFKSS